MLRRKYIFKKFLPRLCSVGLFFILFSFKDLGSLHQLIQQTVLKLNAAYNLNGESVQIRKFDLQITENGFFRYKKYLISGKQEYYSFNLLQFNDLDYLGNINSGTLTLRTLNDDIIVQSFNDPKGDIDSMAFQVDIPVKEIEAEDLQDIRKNFLSMKKQLQ